MGDRGQSWASGGRGRRGRGSGVGGEQRYDSYGSNYPTEPYNPHAVSVNQIPLPHQSQSSYAPIPGQSMVTRNLPPDPYASSSSKPLHPFGRQENHAPAPPPVTAFANYTSPPHPRQPQTNSEFASHRPAPGHVAPQSGNTGAPPRHGLDSHHQHHEPQHRHHEPQHHHHHHETHNNNPPLHRHQPAPPRAPGGSRGRSVPHGVLPNHPQGHSHRSQSSYAPPPKRLKSSTRSPATRSVQHKVHASRLPSSSSASKAGNSTFESSAATINSSPPSSAKKTALEAIGYVVPEHLGYTYVKDDMSKELECAICHNPLDDSRIHRNCDSSFCLKCIKQKAFVCPVCKADGGVSRFSPLRNKILLKLLGMIRVKCKQCDMEVQRSFWDAHVRVSCSFPCPLECGEQITKVGARYHATICPKVIEKLADLKKESNVDVEQDSESKEKVTESHGGESVEKEAHVYPLDGSTNSTRSPTLASQQSHEMSLANNCGSCAQVVSIMHHFRQEFDSYMEEMRDIRDEIMSHWRSTYSLNGEQGNVILSSGTKRKYPSEVSYPEVSYPESDAEMPEVNECELMEGRECDVSYPAEVEFEEGERQMPRGESGDEDDQESEEREEVVEKRVTGKQDDGELGEGRMKLETDEEDVEGEEDDGVITL